jgi:molybdenum cofactor biosynthesis enzyme MoaA
MTYYEVEPQDSSFYTIGVDITHRCNMACANCYSPEREVADFKTEDLVIFFNKLKKRTEIRFTGGEPTLRSDLPLLIHAAKKAGHRVAIMTNGLKLADLEYCQMLYESGLRFVCLSMNGVDDDTVYEQMDGIPCASKKMRALENCVTTGFFININLILARGINEASIVRLVELMKTYNVKCTLRFRNIGQVGRFLKRENYSYSEMLHVVPQLLNIPIPDYSKYNVVNGFQEERNVLFPLSSDPSNKIWIKLTDWAPVGSSIPDPNSRRRGRLTKSLKVAPFFENVELLGY